MLDHVARVEGDDPRHAIDRAIWRDPDAGYLDFAATDPNMLAMAFLPINPPDAEPSDDPNPWQVLADLLDAPGVVFGAMPAERRAGAELIALARDPWVR